MEGGASIPGGGCRPDHCTREGGGKRLARDSLMQVKKQYSYAEVCVLMKKKE